MTNLFLLKIVADLLKADKPSAEEIRVARLIIDGLIKEEEPPLEPERPMVIETEVDRAKRELM